MQCACREFELLVQASGVCLLILIIYSILPHAIQSFNMLLRTSTCTPDMKYLADM